MSGLTALAIGTLALRPYVFVFLAIYLAAAARDLGLRRALAFTGSSWVVALAAEFSSTRTGIPFGLYHYTQATRGGELFVANVPFMDSLSFTFLAYASLCVARRVLPPRRRAALAFLAGLLMMWLDVVIDPLAVRGDRWFLGRIFYYPDGGAYFGVPLSNFLGWAVVGWLAVGGFLAVAGLSDGDGGGNPWPGTALYYAVLVFNLAITGWIGEPLLLAVGLALHAIALAVLWALTQSWSPIRLKDRVYI